MSTALTALIPVLLTISGGLCWLAFTYYERYLVTADRLRRGLSTLSSNVALWGSIGVVLVAIGHSNDLRQDDGTAVESLTPVELENLARDALILKWVLVAIAGVWAASVLLQGVTFLVEILARPSTSEPGSDS